MMKDLKQPKVGAVASNFAFEPDAVGQCTVSCYAVSRASQRDIREKNRGRLHCRLCKAAARFLG